MTDTLSAQSKRNIWVLVAAQAILGSQITMIFTIGGLAGLMLAPSICWATLPISIIILGSTITAPWLSPFMQRYGRRAGFWLGSGAGLVGAAISSYGLYLSSFTVFLIGCLFTGIYQSSQGFFRFAAADSVPDHFKPKAISYVLAGGLISALVGPQLVKLSDDQLVVPFLGSYLLAMLINLIGMLLFVMFRLPKPAAADINQPNRKILALLADPVIRVSVICAMVSYAMMNLVMTATPLTIVGCNLGQSAASDVVSAHVVAMFLPSFFTGHVIARYGTTRVIALGMVILAGAGIIALMGVQLSNFFGALILLGLGWNFGFIGATTMLTQATAPNERGRVQGLNDALVFGSVTIASLASGGMLNCSGRSISDGWNLVNMAMFPAIGLALISLIWLARLKPQNS